MKRDGQHVMPSIRLFAPSRVAAALFNQYPAAEASREARRPDGASRRCGRFTEQRHRQIVREPKLDSPLNFSDGVGTPVRGLAGRGGEEGALQVLDVRHKRVGVRRVKEGRARGACEQEGLERWWGMVAALLTGCVPAGGCSQSATVKGHLGSGQTARVEASLSCPANVAGERRHDVLDGMRAAHAHPCTDLPSVENVGA